MIYQRALFVRAAMGLCFAITWTRMAMASQGLPSTTAPVVQRTMKYLTSRSHLPLYGPRYVPMKPAMDPRPYPAVSSTVVVTDLTYQVGLTYTDKALPVNSPEIDTPKYTGLANLLGGFGVQQYSTRSKATEAVGTALWPLQGPVSSRRLVRGIVGEVSNTDVKRFGRGAGMVTWRQGPWTMQVRGTSLSDNLALANSMIDAIDRSPLPHQRGLFQIDNAGDGEHTRATWALGRVQLNCSNYHDAREALEMVKSMRPFVHR